MARYMLIGLVSFAFTAGWSHRSALTAESAIAQLAFIQQRMNKTQNRVGKMSKVIQGLHKLVAKAKKDKDMVKMNCINDKIEKIKGWTRVAVSNFVALRHAVALEKVDGAKSAYSNVQLAHVETLELEKQARECRSITEITEPGKMALNVEIDPDKSGQDMPDKVDLPKTGVVRPIPASPYY